MYNRNPLGILDLKNDALLNPYDLMILRIRRVIHQCINCALTLTKYRVGILLCYAPTKLGEKI